jgi:hypothetical protein
MRRAGPRRGGCLRLWQFGATAKPGKLEVLDLDDTFCAAHGGQQLAFWNAHHDERGFASMHIYHVLIRAGGRCRARRCCAEMLSAARSGA